MQTAHRVQAGNLETDVECVPRPRQWVCSFELQNRRKCCCFIPALTHSLRLPIYLAVLAFLPAGLSQQCGGDERWPVKVGSDDGAALVNLTPVPIIIHDLVRIERPQLPDDDNTRLPQERTVYVVDGRLVKFKLESGKKGDQDYHLVFTDDTLLFSPPGSGTTPVEHSIVAEIVNPDCIPGRNGTAGTTSHFQDGIAETRAFFNQHFPNITGGWNDANGVHVRITGVGFFDRPHGQVGRALNGMELHPVLNIEFDGNAPHDRPVGRGISFTLKEHLRRSLPRHSPWAAT